MEPETRDYFFKAQSTLTLFKTQDLHSSCCLQAMAQELQMALKDQPMAAGSLRLFFKRLPSRDTSHQALVSPRSRRPSLKERVGKLKLSQKQGGHQQWTTAQQNKEHRGEERPQWVKAFGNYCPNQWITDGQVNNYRCSQVQMASRRLEECSVEQFRQRELGHHFRLFRGLHCFLLMLFLQGKSWLTYRTPGRDPHRVPVPVRLPPRLGAPSRRHPRVGTQAGPV
ncbi:hypothetical protein COCON_G00235100 [Conger conger]|uniref:Uncharacterized protein n=1 Tax=Conger conger TaxID=82655 RepID=A0A9Q1CU63_CONCO|nr:hypothetical protein COCON_G00235100 [Conger conger]